ncbi:hypothetical protein PZA11_006297 [Diplocarpon coronariae]
MRSRDTSGVRAGTLRWLCRPPWWRLVINQASRTQESTYSTSPHTSSSPLSDSSIVILSGTLRARDTNQDMAAMAQEKLKVVFRVSKARILATRLPLISNFLCAGDSRCVDTTPVARPAAPQRQSPLLSLPREIRDMIWREVLGGMILHLWTDDAEPSRLRGLRCRAGDVACRLRCRAWLERPGAEQWPRIGVVGFLSSCLQMYVEGARYLYERNELDTRSGEVISQPSSRLLAAGRYDSIRAFTLCWTLPESPSLPTATRELCRQSRFDEAIAQTTGRPRRWIHAWKTLAQMRGLVRLRIELNIVGREDGWGVWDGQWTVADLEIARVVRRPRTFVLVTSDRVVERLRERIRAPNLTILGVLEEQSTTGDADAETWSCGGSPGARLCPAAAGEA